MHILPRGALTGGDECIRVDESTDFGIVISALEVIQPGLCGAGLAKHGCSYITPTPQR